MNVLPANNGGAVTNATTAVATLPANSGGAIWGNKTVVFLGGLAVLLWLGGTRAAPVVIAFLATVIVYWVINR